jgi:hypothetical protein
VRITAQLVDAIQDYHLWSERYDRPLTEIFTLQDEIRQKIVTALRVKLTKEMNQGWLYLLPVNLYALWIAIQKTKETIHFVSRQVRSQLQKDLPGNVHIQLRQTLKNFYARWSLRGFSQAEDPDVSVQYHPFMRDSHGRQLLPGPAQARP